VEVVLDVGPAHADDGGALDASEDVEPDDPTVPERAVGDGADALVAAGQEPADGAADHARHHGDLEVVPSGGLFELAERHAGLDVGDAAADRADGVAAAEVEHDAALERDGLAVVAGAAAARRDRDAVAVGDVEHGGHVGRGGAHDDVGDALGEVLEQDGRQPRVVARRAAPRRLIDRDDAVPGAEQAGELVDGPVERGHGAPRSGLSSS
jgi:hypothetical protein